MHFLGGGFLWLKVYLSQSPDEISSVLSFPISAISVAGMYSDQECTLFDYCRSKVHPVNCVDTLFGATYKDVVVKLLEKGRGRTFKGLMKNIVCSDMYMHTLHGIEKQKWVAARVLLANSGCKFAHGVDAFDLRRSTAGVYDKQTGVRMNGNPALRDMGDEKTFAIEGIHEFQDVISPLIFTSDEQRPSELFSSMASGGKMGAAGTRLLMLRPAPFDRCSQFTGFKVPGNALTQG